MTSLSRNLSFSKLFDRNCSNRIPQFALQWEKRGGEKNRRSKAYKDTSSEVKCLCRQCLLRSILGRRSLMWMLTVFRLMIHSAISPSEFIYKKAPLITES
ncbi:hypothetical protein CEXT_534231 [Caerostris extrusa]|uniref:Uncharacterized protein n=1 Tax=Caerostris extrusa TaxID=172846 RepID=A0AAV4QRU3_CAEEX|nr:hypothetical protein CEXT_534231 [Caerostris extrusa]